MADIAFPTAKVVFRAAAIAQDSDDSGSIPQEILLGGIRVTLIPALKYVEVAAPPGGVNPTTYSLRTWNLITTNDGNLINMDDPEEEVLIVASDAFPGYVVSWKSIIEDPSETLPPIVKKWLAPAGSIVDLTTVISVPNNPNPIADYLQAVYDAREARDNAIAAKNDAGDSASAAAESAGQAQQSAAYELRGIGSPLGVVSAPPGTYYTDISGTCGAWRWLMTATTGNTGWIVVWGDTGWRDLTALVTNGWSATKVLMRRKTDLVWWFLDGLNGTAATSDDVLPTIPNTSPLPYDAYAHLPLVRGSSDTTMASAPIWGNWTGMTLRFSPRAAFTGGHNLLLSWPTAAPWPTSANLPGIAW